MSRRELSSRPVSPGAKGYETATAQECYRRIRDLIERHPYLTGLMAGDFVEYLDRVWRDGSGLVPTAPPDFEAEFGYDDLVIEGEQEWADYCAARSEWIRETFDGPRTES